jgi:hypothetical protein
MNFLPVMNNFYKKSNNNNKNNNYNDGVKEKRGEGEIITE